MSQDPAAAPAEWDAVIARRYPEYAALITRNLVTHRDWCRAVAVRHRIWFRLSGVLVIAFSVSLPVLTSVSFSGRNVVVSVLALGVAGLSALRAFYQWDHSWRLYRSQDLTLTALLIRWQMGMMQIVRSSAEDGDDQAHDLTMGILQELHESGRAELDEFFTGIAWPDRRGT
jgi:hypothetical protein